MERFYSRVDPSKLVHVSTILSKFEGNEERMFAMLEKMFPGEVCERPQAV